MLKYLIIDINTLLCSTGGAVAGTATATSEKVAALEQKLFKTQEELTELHRWKSEVWADTSIVLWNPPHYGFMGEKIHLVSIFVNIFYFLSKDFCLPCFLLYNCCI